MPRRSPEARKGVKVVGCIFHLVKAYNPTGWEQKCLKKNSLLWKRGEWLDQRSHSAAG